MDQRESLIEKLVVSLHLDVAERQLLASPVTVREVAATVRRLLDRDGVFPGRARNWRDGELVFEGYFLVRTTDGRVQLNWQRSRPISPRELAERTALEFNNTEEAIAEFIHAEWPRGIDGIILT